MAARAGLWAGVLATAAVAAAPAPGPEPVSGLVLKAAAIAGGVFVLVLCVATRCRRPRGYATLPTKGSEESEADEASNDAAMSRLVIYGEQELHHPFLESVMIGPERRFRPILDQLEVGALVICMKDYDLQGQRKLKTGERGQVQLLDNNGHAHLQFDSRTSLLRLDPKENLCFLTLKVQVCCPEGHALRSRGRNPAYLTELGIPDGAMTCAGTVGGRRCNKQPSEDECHFSCMAGTCRHCLCEQCYYAALWKSSFVVKGTGQAGADGYYIHCGSHNGRPRFQQLGSTGFLQWEEDVASWRLRSSSSSRNAGSSWCFGDPDARGSDQELPPKGEWRSAAPALGLADTAAGTGGECVVVRDRFAKWGDRMKGHTIMGQLGTAGGLLGGANSANIFTYNYHQIQVQEDMLWVWFFVVDDFFLPNIMTQQEYVEEIVEKGSVHLEAFMNAMSGSSQVRACHWHLMRGATFVFASIVAFGWSRATCEDRAPQWWNFASQVWWHSKSACDGAGALWLLALLFEVACICCLCCSAMASPRYDGRNVIQDVGKWVLAVAAACALVLLGGLGWAWPTVVDRYHWLQGFSNVVFWAFSGFMLLSTIGTIGIWMRLYASASGKGFMEFVEENAEREENARQDGGRRRQAMSPEQQREHERDLKETWLNCVQCCMAPCVGFSKAVVVVKHFVVPAIFYYADIATDLIALEGFYRSGRKQYFTLNIAAIAIAALSGALFVQRNSAVSIPMTALLALACLFQLMPLLCLVAGVGLIVHRGMEENAERMLRRSGILPMMEMIVSAEGFVEALLSSDVQIYSLIHDEIRNEDDKIQKQHLRISLVMSILSLTKAFSELDLSGKVSRYSIGIPWLQGTAYRTQPAFLVVVLYRLSSLVSRLLLFPIFQELTHDLLRHHGASWGAFALFGLDFLLQACLVLYYTRNPWKIVHAAGNTISPLEPLLLVGGAKPVLTAPPHLVALIHLMELMGAVAFVFGLHAYQGVLAILRRNGNLSYAVLILAGGLLQWPLLALAQVLAGGFAREDAPEQQTLEQYVLSNHMDARLTELLKAGLDDADRRVPFSMVERGFRYAGLNLRMLSLEQGLWGVSKRSIQGNGMRLVTTALRLLPGIRKLNLKQNSLGEANCELLAAAVPPAVETLELSSCDVGPSGARHLGKALSKTRLRFLRIDANRLADEGVWSIAAAVKADQFLRFLDISCNGMSELGAESLAQALRGHASLTVLQLHYNSIGDEGFSLLMEALQEDGGRVRELSVRGCGITAASAAKAGHELRRNTQLRLLDLSENNLGPQFPFAEVLQSLSLRTLILQNCGITTLPPAFGTLRKVNLINRPKRQWPNNLSQEVVRLLVAQVLSTLEEFSCDGFSDNVGLQALHGMTLQLHRQQRVLCETPMMGALVEASQDVALRGQALPMEEGEQGEVTATDALGNICLKIPGRGDCWTLERHLESLKVQQNYTTDPFVRIYSPLGDEKSLEQRVSGVFGRTGQAVARDGNGLYTMYTHLGGNGSISHQERSADRPAMWYIADHEGKCAFENADAQGGASSGLPLHGWRSVLIRSRSVCLAVVGASSPLVGCWQVDRGGGSKTFCTIGRDLVLRMTADGPSGPKRLFGSLAPVNEEGRSSSFRGRLVDVFGNQAHDVMLRLPEDHGVLELQESGGDVPTSPTASAGDLGTSVMRVARAARPGEEFLVTTLTRCGPTLLDVGDLLRVPGPHQLIDVHHLCPPIPSNLQAFVANGWEGSGYKRGGLVTATGGVSFDRTFDLKLSLQEYREGKFEEKLQKATASWPASERFIRERDLRFFDVQGRVYSAGMMTATDDLFPLRVQHVPPPPEATPGRRAPAARPELAAVGEELPSLPQRTGSRPRPVERPPLRDLEDPDQLPDRGVAKMPAVAAAAAALAGLLIAWLRLLPATWSAYSFVAWHLLARCCCRSAASAALSLNAAILGLHAGLGFMDAALWLRFGDATSVAGPWAAFSFLTCVLYFDSFVVESATLPPSVISVASFWHPRNVAYNAVVVASCAEYFLERQREPEYKSFRILAVAGSLCMVVGQLLISVAGRAGGRSFWRGTWDGEEKVKIADHRIVREGIFRYARHPAYLGVLLWGIGAEVVLCNPLMLLVAGVGLWVAVVSIISSEEQVLLEEFNGMYASYCLEAPCWIPSCERTTDETLFRHSNVASTDFNMNGEVRRLYDLYQSPLPAAALEF